jgi:shikimate kinase
MKYFLTGFMGSGKTESGRILSTLLNIPFIELDKAIVREAGKTVSRIFSEDGEEFFRKKEHEILKRIAEGSGAVVSTGGGVPCHYNNMELMNLSGITVYLKTNADELFRRLEKHKAGRPLIENLEGASLKKFIEVTLTEREPFYSLAHHTVDVSNISAAEAAREIARYDEHLYWAKSK